MCHYILKLGPTQFVRERFPSRRDYCVSPAKASLHALYRYMQNINGTHGVPLHIHTIVANKPDSRTQTFFLRKYRYLNGALSRPSLIKKLMPE